MANDELSIEPFDFGGGQDVYDLLQGREKEGVNNLKQTHSIGIESWDIDYLWSEYGLYQDDTYEIGVPMSIDHQQQPLADFNMQDDFYFNIFSSPIQLCQEPTKLDTNITQITEPVEPMKERRCLSPLSSLVLLNNYRSGSKRLDGDKQNKRGRETTLSTTEGGRELSTEEVMRVAGARYIRYSVEKGDGLAMLRRPFGSVLSGVTSEKAKDVELAQFLLASAEKVGNQQFEKARKLLSQCDEMSSQVGNPVQRVVYYFAKALQDKIDRETGRIQSKRLEEKGGLPVDPAEAKKSPNPAHLAWHRELPFYQVLQFTGVQAIIDSVASAKRVHLIDLGIKIGFNWSALMQALATRLTCPLEFLKITAVGTSSRDKIKETGKRLESFAEAMNISFSFKIVFISDLKELKEDLFELGADEAVAVYCPFILKTMISRPECLENVMRVIRNLNPCIMVVTEIEANHNSPSFVDRFIEALFFYSAFFDCLEECLDRSNQIRMTAEEGYFAPAIWNTVATEGEERTVRHVVIDVWRAFFARFGMVETELSQSSLFQASLVVKQFSCASSCTLDMTGKCLTVGWKGTPLHSLSAWKFN